MSNASRRAKEVRLTVEVTYDNGDVETLDINKLDVTRPGHRIEVDIKNPNTSDPWTLVQTDPGPEEMRVTIIGKPVSSEDGTYAHIRQVVIGGTQYEAG